LVGITAIVNLEQAKQGMVAEMGLVLTEGPMSMIPHPVVE
jgi:hypothetical protein